MAGRRLDRRHQELAVAVAVASLALGACAAPEPLPDGALTVEDLAAGAHLAGRWAWLHDEIADGTFRHEGERWWFIATDDRAVLDGHYARDVVVRALDDVPFVCDQRPAYALHADHHVRVQLVNGGARIAETGYQAAPSPCDAGLRALTTYDAELAGERVILRWDGGDETLVRIPDDAADPPPPPPAPPAPAGRWTWTMTSWTREGLVRDEAEDWELATGAAHDLAGTYRRTVTVRSPDRTPIACAGGSSYRFVDTYLIRGRLGDDGWRLEETAVDAGPHPCLAATPGRSLDSATFETLGDFLVLDWRGKRRQVLGRD